jgi:hypothetical protein
MVAVSVFGFHCGHGIPLNCMSLGIALAIDVYED